MTASPPRLSKCSDGPEGGQLSACPSAQRQGTEAKLLPFTFPWVVTRRRGTPSFLFRKVQLLLKPSLNEHVIFDTCDISVFQTNQLQTA